MSTVSTNPTQAGPAFPQAAAFPVDYHTAGRPLALPRDDEPNWGGVSLSGWLKIGVVALLMALLFRFNLARLWLKTNPFTGQANWGHAFFVPLIGLYYLYVHRSELIRPSPAPKPAGSVTMAWGLSVLVAALAGLLVWAAVPGVVGWVESPLENSSIPYNYHGWHVVPAYLLTLFAAVSAGLLMWWGNSDEGRRDVQAWSARAVPNLLAWGMAAAAVWGTAFFVSVVSEAAFTPVRIILAVVSLTSLGLIVWGGGTRGALAAGVAQAVESIRQQSGLWFGGFVMVWGILFSFWGIWPGQNDFFKDVGMVIALFGVVLLLGGWGVTRTAWFPVLFLFCALPWPDQVYSWIAGPLQHLAAAVAVRVLTIFHVPSQVSGTKIVMGDVGDDIRILNVAEACAGLRSLMTFISLAAGWAFVVLTSRPLWQRLLVAASAVPIAILCNVMRVSGQGLLDHFCSHQLSEGFAHQFAGLVMLIPAFFMILLAGYVLDHLFIEEADDPAAVKRGAAATAAAARGPAGAKTGKVLVVPRQAATGVRPAAAPRSQAAPPATAAPARLQAEPAAPVVPAAPVARPAAAAPAPVRRPAARPAGAPPASPAARPPARTPPAAPQTAAGGVAGSVTGPEAAPPRVAPPGAARPPAAGAPAARVAPGVRSGTAPKPPKPPGEAPAE